MVAKKRNGEKEGGKQQQQQNNRQFTTNEIAFAKNNIKYVFKCQMYYFVENNKNGYSL